MLELVLVVSTILSTILWIKAESKLVKTQKLLIEAEQVNYSTPIKELASSFREFVEGIDGKVSPEVDDAIKKLEATETKALPAPVPVPVPEKPKKAPRPVMNVQIWNLFSAEYKATEDDDEKLQVIRRWGKKYIFALEDQIELITGLQEGYDREELRDYFEDFHQTQVISIG